jgi:integrase
VRGDRGIFRRHEPDCRHGRRCDCAWWIVYFDEHGRRHREKVGPKAVAQDVYRKRKTEVRERRFFPEAAQPWSPPFAEYINDYLSRRRSTLRDPSGAERYGRYWCEAPETAGKRMRELTTQDFERYRERRRGRGAPGARRQRRGASASTLNKELSFARAVFNDFIEALQQRQEPPMFNPVRKRLFEPEAATRTRYLSDDEETRLREAMPPEAWLKVQVAMLTGLDRGAQFGLRWEQVDLQARVIRAERRKGRRVGTVPVTVAINDELLAVLRGLPSRLSSCHVFPNTAGTGPENGKAFDYLVFRKALKRAGIADFRWKDLRHTFASRLRMSGVELATVRDLLGHTTTRMTERYAHIGAGHLQDAVQRISRVQGEAPTATSTATGGPHGTTRPPQVRETASVPERIRTAVTGVKGRCPRPG